MKTSAEAIPEKRRARTEPFQWREMHRVALLSFNEFGFRESARIALEYVNRAMDALESAARKKPHARSAAEELKESAVRLKEDCEYLRKYHESREKFKTVSTQWAVEWTSKQAVRALSRGHITQFHDLLAHKIRRFHSEVSAILNEVSGNELSFAKK